MHMLTISISLALTIRVVLVFLFLPFSALDMVLDFRGAVAQLLALTEIDPPYAHGKGLPELNESD